MSPSRRSWSYNRTPLGIYCLVMGPICAVQLFVLTGNSPSWMRWSSGAVVALTLVGFFRGYVRRLVLDRDAAHLVRLWGSIRIPWSMVRRVGRYVPGGGYGTTEYVYITTRDVPPAGKWDIDHATLQVQDRPNLLGHVETIWREAGGGCPSSHEAQSS